MPPIIYNPFGVIRDALYAALTTVLPTGLANGLLALIGAAIVVGVVPGLVIGQVYMERRLLARAQDRIGPNRVGPFGLLQPIADVVKLLAKEDIMPARADKLMFTLAPVLVLSAS